MSRDFHLDLRSSLRSALRSLNPYARERAAVLEGERRIAAWEARAREAEAEVARQRVYIEELHRKGGRA